jgi:hypothetical protein
VEVHCPSDSVPFDLHHCSTGAEFGSLAVGWGVMRGVPGSFIFVGSRLAGRLGPEGVDVRFAGLNVLQLIQPS